MRRTPAELCPCLQPSHAIFRKTQHALQNILNKILQQRTGCITPSAFSSGKNKSKHIIPTAFSSVAKLSLTGLVGARPLGASLGSGTAFSTASPTLFSASSTLPGSATDCTWSRAFSLVSLAVAAASEGALPGRTTKMKIVFCHRKFRGYLNVKTHQLQSLRQCRRWVLSE